MFRRNTVPSEPRAGGGGAEARPSSARKSRRTYRIAKCLCTAKSSRRTYRIANCLCTAKSSPRIYRIANCLCTAKSSRRTYRIANCLCTARASVDRSRGGPEPPLCILLQFNAPLQIHVVQRSCYVKFHQLCMCTRRGVSFMWVLSHLEYYDPVNTVQVMPSKSNNLLNFSSPETKAQGEQLQSPPVVVVCPQFL